MGNALGSTPCLGTCPTFPPLLHQGLLLFSTVPSQLTPLIPTNFMSPTCPRSPSCCNLCPLHTHSHVIINLHSPSPYRLPSSHKLRALFISPLWSFCLPSCQTRPCSFCKKNRYYCFLFGREVEVLQHNGEPHCKDRRGEIRPINTIVLEIVIGATSG